MIAAIYGRKSTKQEGVADEAKSVTRQVDNARAFATSKGWTVADQHVYVDDGVSGAEFERRPGFMRLLAALEPTPPFEVLIVSDRKSLGRESYETGYRCQGRSNIRPPWRRNTRPSRSGSEFLNAAMRRRGQDAGAAGGWRAFLLCSRR